MGTKLGPRQRIEWDVRRNKVDTKGYSFVPETIVKKLGLTVSKTSAKLSLNDVVKKNKKGRRYPSGSSSSIGSVTFDVDLGTKTAKGNPKHVSLIGPAGATVSEAITLLSAGKKAQRVRIEGNERWYSIPGAT